MLFRSAVKNSQKGKIKTMTHSSLEKIEGIGPAKAKALLKAMPLGKIRNASVDELCEIKGISRSDAERIVKYFNDKRGKSK